MNIAEWRDKKNVYQQGTRECYIFKRSVSKQEHVIPKPEQFSWSKTIYTTSI